MDPYVGEIRLLPYNFAPLNWHDCDGSLLPISEYDTLFNLIGTTYGGDGQSTFALPDLRGRLPIHQGTGPGLSTYSMGQLAGTETVTLTSGQMPAHTHTAVETSGVATTGTPGGNVELGAVSGDSMYTSDISGLTPFAASNTMIGPAGGNQPHDNTMPTLTVRFCISLYGIYPSQA
ncbi:MAG: phage tail protein [Rhodanobacter sp. SCN 65-17]|jgi:microcystin-dependent protein|nr:MAG: phage tail protein [Rhodanobacter sp. SCN 65-17]